ncbi:CZB domain-containing protein [Hymenobacter sp. B81]|uniref:CZB domain-containing protein n=1 Tax=Hymenobacter sp. B81 TaxID=3344878 RepID=UPI0037DCE920
MTHDDLQREFNTARLKHRVFKAKLRSFLYGSGTDEQPIRDAQVCSFGQWLLQVGLPQLGHLPAMQQLERVHTAMHATANRLLDLHQAGQAEAAVAGLSEVDRIAEQMMSLLHIIEENSRREGR